METIRTKYLGDLRTEAIHIRSGDRIITDAPSDNKGKGEAFSPTDLASAALGSCMLTIIGIAARDHGFNIDGTELSITKIMDSNPRRIGEIKIVFKLPYLQYTEREKKIIERAARTCPVALSLHPDVIKTLEFRY